MKKCNYQIITHTRCHDGDVYKGTYDYNGFQEKVEDFLSKNKGWEPVGGITATKANLGNGMEYTLAQSFFCKET